MTRPGSRRDYLRDQRQIDDKINGKLGGRIIQSSDEVSLVVDSCVTMCT